MNENLDRFLDPQWDTQINAAGDIVGKETHYTCLPQYTCLMSGSIKLALKAAGFTERLNYLLFFLENHGVSSFRVDEKQIEFEGLVFSSNSRVTFQKLTISTPNVLIIIQGGSSNV